jgi:aryl-alcohol dehydrogenase-like predicted oxidoreductase
MGRTGLKVTEVCLGTMTFGLQCDEETSFGIMDASAELGVNFIDTADAYPLGGEVEDTGRTEEIVGRWLKGKRDDYVLATKCFGVVGRRPNDRGLSRKHIIEACENSLRRLQTDYIDLYQAHSPDHETPLDETLRAFDDLVRAGKARYIGCSNFPAWRLARSLGVSERLNLARFDCDQPRYNLLFREIETEILPLCREDGIGVIAYNPLAGGFLTGKYQPGDQPVEGTRFTLGRAAGMYQKRYWNDACFEAVEELKDYFAPREKPLAQVALAWVLRQPGITSAIVGASRPEQLRESLGGVDLNLDDEELQVLDEVWYKLPRASDPAVALR